MALELDRRLVIEGQKKACFWTAQETKQINGLENLEQRLLKAQKRKMSNYLERVTELQKALFPNESLQERQMNFSEFYLENGDAILPKLLEHLEPLKGEFLVLTI